MTKLKKAIKGTQATSKLPASKLPASTGRPTAMEASNHVMNAHRFRHSNNNEGGMSGPVEDIEALRAERDKLTNEENAIMLASTPLAKAVPSLSPIPVAQSASVAQTTQAITETPVVKAPAAAPVKEAPLSSMLTHEVYTKLTGKPWSTAKKEGLTDGSAASNLKLKAMLLDKANKVPASKSTVDKPASVKLENKDIADLRKKMTTPMVKTSVTKAATRIESADNGRASYEREKAKTDSTMNAKLSKIALETLKGPTSLRNLIKPTNKSVATPKSIAQPKAEAKPVSSMDRTVKSLRDLTKKNIERLPKKYEDISEPKTAFQKQQDEDDEFERIKGYRRPPRGVVHLHQKKALPKVVKSKTAFEKQQDQDDEFERIKGYRPAPRGIVKINR